MKTNEPVYDREKFLRFISRDQFLWFTWNGYKASMGEDVAEVMLEPMFNTYVREDSAATRAYEATP